MKESKMVKETIFRVYVQKTEKSPVMSIRVCSECRAIATAEAYIKKGYMATAEADCRLVPAMH